MSIQSLCLFLLGQGDLCKSNLIVSSPAKNLLRPAELNRLLTRVTPTSLSSFLHTFRPQSPATAIRNLLPTFMDSTNRNPTRVYHVPPARGQKRSVGPTPSGLESSTTHKKRESPADTYWLEGRAGSRPEGGRTVWRRQA